MFKARPPELLLASPRAAWLPLYPTCLDFPGHSPFLAPLVLTGTAGGRIPVRLADAGLAPI